MYVTLPLTHHTVEYACSAITVSHVLYTTEVGEVITFLSSDKASYITGTTIEIAGQCGSHNHHMYIM